MKLFQAILSVVRLAPNSKPAQPYLSPEHPASIQFSAWLNAINTGDRETITAYHTDLAFPLSAWGVGHSGLGGLELETDFAQIMGGFDIARVESSDDPSLVVVVLREKKYQLQHFRANMSVDISRPTYPATGFNFMPTITPLDLIRKDDPLRSDYEKAMQPLTPARRRAVIDGFFDVLKEEHVDPAVAEDIRIDLEAKMVNGEYDSIHDNEKFSYQLSHDLVSHEKHMFVLFVEPRPGLNHSDAGPAPQKHLEGLQRMNFGFGTISLDTESIPGHTIATLPINSFIHIDKRYMSDSEEIQAAVGDIMSSVSDADALIIDLRINHGGDPRTVAFIESYLLDNAPLHLLDIVFRNGTIEESHSTLTTDELPAGAKRFGGTKPLFVLTTNNTVSGGEDLAYSLQSFKRTQAIIGEGNDATAGAANLIKSTHFIAEEVFGKGWWVVGVPNVRPVHAVTGVNWGKVGVKSDVVAGKGEWAEEKDAMEVARQLAVRALQPDKEL